MQAGDSDTAGDTTDDDGAENENTTDKNVVRTSKIEKYQDRHVDEQNAIVLFLRLCSRNCDDEYAKVLGDTGTANKDNDELVFGMSEYKTKQYVAAVDFVNQQNESGGVGRKVCGMRAAHTMRMYAMYMHGVHMHIFSRSYFLTNWRFYIEC